MQSTPVRLPGLHYLYGEILDTEDQANPASLPENRINLLIRIVAIGGPVQYEINGIATANSPGHLPSASFEVIGPITNLENFSVYIPAGSTARLMYFRQGNWS